MASRSLAAAVALVGCWVQVAHGQDTGRAAIAGAVERGIAHLRSVQNRDGSWPTHKMGGTALVGLTLLECNVSSTDPAIQKAAEYLRGGWDDISDLHTTYSLALTILFFDRLGEPHDVPIIQALGARLLAGQNSAGGWSYSCPQFNADDHTRLRAAMSQEVALKAGNGLPRTGRTTDDRSGLPREIRQVLNRLETQKPATLSVEQDPSRGHGGDNSNTQFAILALWAARRHGVPTEKALGRAAARFRGCQHPDGGWGYTTNPTAKASGDGSTPSMTCAGLLGLAVGYGGAFEAVLRATVRGKPGKSSSTSFDPANDPAICSAFAALARTIGGRPQIDLPGAITGIGDLYYLLWSIERVAMVYSQSLIGGKDWYAWGAGLLLGEQQSGGGWKGRFGSDIDTCFALMFLRRVDLAPDLSSVLRNRGMEVALKANAKVDKLTKGLSQTDLGYEGTKQSNSADRESAVADRGGKSRTSADGSPASPAARLGEDLIRLAGVRQDSALDQLKDGKGAAFTEALAAAIPSLSGTIKTKAREALAERLARMTVATLRDKLQDDGPEVRRAAALACAAKADQDLVPDLISALEDREATVARAAHIALKHLTGKDFGPADNATSAERSKATVSWREWLRNRR